MASVISFILFFGPSIRFFLKCDSSFSFSYFFLNFASLLWHTFRQTSPLTLFFFQTSTCSWRGSVPTVWWRVLRIWIMMPLLSGKHLWKPTQLTTTRQSSVHLKLWTRLRHHLQKQASWVYHWWRTSINLWSWHNISIHGILYIHSQLFQHQHSKSSRCLQYHQDSIGRQ